MRYISHMAHNCRWEERGTFTYGEYLQVRRAGYIYIRCIFPGEESGVHSHTREFVQVRRAG